MAMIQACDDTSSDLLARARRGDQDAWQVLFQDCYPKIHRVISRRLNGRLRRVCDSTDIANEVMKSLAEKFNRFDFTSIDGLRAFLIHAAEQKVIDEQRKGHAQKRDNKRERPLASGDGDSAAWEPADKSPTASQVAVASEERERLLGQQSGAGREILELKTRGFSNSDASEATGWKIRKVERFLEKLRGTWRL